MLKPSRSQIKTCLWVLESKAEWFVAGHGLPCVSGHSSITQMNTVSLLTWLVVCTSAEETCWLLHSFALCSLMTNALWSRLLHGSG